MKQSIWKKWLKIGLLLVVCLLSSYCIYRYSTHSKVYVDKKIEHVKLDHIDKIMIVAHPDDDSIWGGSHLLEDDYLVVCITCGGRRDRVREFKAAMKETNDKYLMLGYPDKTNGKRDDWSQVYEDIYQDLKHILEYKEWSQIVTHNPEGEYGHNHHKMTSSIVTDIMKDFQETERLLYFGKYYAKDKLPSDLKRISDENYDKKVNDLIPLYPSQKSTMKKFEHMFAYENWLSYQEWNEKYGK